MDTSLHEADEFEKMLSAFNNLTTRKTPRTLLEISKVPRSELACSNILEFFLDQNEEHGLGDLFLKTLLQAARPDLASHDLRHAQVWREERTESNKSLDIVILGKSFVVGIENKIDAPLKNPFEDYDRRLTEIAKENDIEKEKIERIILCLQEAECSEFGFKPITYDKWFSELLRQTTDHLLTADLRYLTYLTDFMTTIQNLKKGIRMDDRTLRFFRENRESTAKLSLRMQELRKMLAEKTAVLKNLEDLPKGIKIKSWGTGEPFVYGPDDESLYFHSTVYCEKEINKDLSLCIEATLLLSEKERNSWQILVYDSNGDNEGLVNNWLKQNTNIKLAPQGVYKKFPFAESPDVVAKEYLGLIKAICKKG